MFITHDFDEALKLFQFLEKSKVKQVQVRAKKNIGETNQLSCKIAASYFDLEDEEKGLQFLENAIKEDLKSIPFFLEYYPEGARVNKIMNLINLFQKEYE
mgnify:CR=1 FL=1